MLFKAFKIGCSSPFFIRLINTSDDTNNCVNKIFNRYYKPEFITLTVHVNSNISKLEIDLTISSQNGSVGTGNSININLFEPNYIEKCKENIKNYCMPESLKKLFLESINDGLYQEHMELSYMLDYFKNELKDNISNYVEEHIEDYKTYNSLKENNLKENLTNYINELYKDYHSDIMDCIKMKYKIKKATETQVILHEVSCKNAGEEYEDENTLIIYFLNEDIKHIHKWSYTEYVIE